MKPTHQPEEQEYGSPIADPIHIIIVVHVGLYGVDESWMKLFCLIKDKESLWAPQNHVSNGFSQLALVANTPTQIQTLTVKFRIPGHVRAYFKIINCTHFSVR